MLFLDPTDPTYLNDKSKDFINKILDCISTSTVFQNYCHLYIVFFDEINMFKSMFSLYFYYLNYTINASPPFKATPPFK